MGEFREKIKEMDFEDFLMNLCGIFFMLLAVLSIIYMCVEGSEKEYLEKIAKNEPNQRIIERLQKDALVSITLINDEEYMIKELEKGNFQTPKIKKMEVKRELLSGYDGKFLVIEDKKKSEAKLLIEGTLDYYLVSLRSEDGKFPSYESQINHLKEIQKIVDREIMLLRTIKRILVAFIIAGALLFIKDIY